MFGLGRRSPGTWINCLRCKDGEGNGHQVVEGTARPICQFELMWLQNPRRISLITTKVFVCVVFMNGDWLGGLY
jgi:hypothetical protein